MNIGIFGVGSFGEKHINVLKMIDSFNIVGFFDPNKKRQKYIENKYQLKAYQNLKKNAGSQMINEFAKKLSERIKFLRPIK